VIYYQKALDLIKRGELVLDVGGARQPFKRANYVIDIIPFEERDRWNDPRPDIREHFAKETWLSFDICDHSKPWPFKDKMFDFCVCGQTLEDLRDPIYVCEEMSRVAKRGFIEVPSRFYEQTYGLEYPGLCGASHHRWIIECINGKLIFVFKDARIHKFRKYQIRKPWFNFAVPVKLNPAYSVIYIEWHDKIIATECIEKSLNPVDFLMHSVELAKYIGSDLWVRG
jgi:hypothetical protein